MLKYDKTKKVWMEGETPISYSSDWREIVFSTSDEIKIQGITGRWYHFRRRYIAIDVHKDDAKQFVDMQKASYPIERKRMDGGYMASIPFPVR